MLTFFKKSLKIQIIDKYEELPSVSLIISAYNEASSIQKKIENSINLDYPLDKVQIIIISDGSTDETANLAKSYQHPNIHVVELNERKGKTYAQNIGASISKGEIFVFSDANTILERDALKVIVSCLLSSEKIGCVSGNLVYIKRKRSIGEPEYQKYETLIKILESRFFSSIGVNGAFYALRKSDFIQLPENIISDFVLPLEIYRKYEKITVLCEQARCLEEIPYKDNDLSGVIQRKSRILSRGLIGMLYVKELLNPLKYPLMSFELFSHKFLRWTSGFLLFLAYFLPLFYFDSLGKLIFGFENLLIVLICIFYLLSKKNSKNCPLLSAVIYFLLVNISQLVGWYYLISRKTPTTWATKR